MVEIFPVKELRTGNTVAFGPDFDVDGQGFYERGCRLDYCGRLPAHRSRITLFGG
jgi:hypothetical protein